MTAFAIAALLGLVCLLAVLSREDRLLQEEQWSGVLSTRAAEQLADLQARYAIERTAADASYSLAETARAHGDTDRAILSAIVPLPPLRPTQFHLGSIRSIAAFGHVAHYLLVAAAERFRLRLWVIRHGFALAVRALLPGSRPPQGRIDAARGDYATLEDETLRSAEALVEALATVAVAAGKARA